MALPVAGAAAKASPSHGGLREPCRHVGANLHSELARQGRLVAAGVKAVEIGGNLAAWTLQRLRGAYLSMQREVWTPSTSTCAALRWHLRDVADDPDASRA